MSLTVKIKKSLCANSMTLNHIIIDVLAANIILVIIEALLIIANAARRKAIATI